MSWYKAGAVAVEPGSTTVTGVGTKFSANSRVGDAFRGPDGNWYEVTNIASSTVLSILPAYQSEPATAAGYLIAPMQGYVKESADRLREIIAGLAGVSDDVAAARGAAAEAAESATAANGSAEQAEQAQAGAAGSASSALASQQTAGLHRAMAEQAAENSLSYRDSANSYKDQAATSAGAAADSAEAAAQSEQNVTHKANSGANSDITSLSGLTTALSVAQGGTGGKTPGAARQGLGLKSASTADIVGTVSHAAGVPTGAIIERGSSASGEFVKLADGTMICMRSYSITVSTASIGLLFRDEAPANGAWVFPAAFAAEPQVFFTPLHGRCWSTSYATAITTATPIIYALSDVKASMTVHAIAIGRWA